MKQAAFQVHKTRHFGCFFQQQKIAVVWSISNVLFFCPPFYQGFIFLLIFFCLPQFIGLLAQSTPS
jgi:hypothetical protein